MDSKEVITLQREKIQKLKSRIENLKQRETAIADKYEKLANSKFGKLQIKYWEIKNWKKIKEREEQQRLLEQERQLKQEQQLEQKIAPEESKDNSKTEVKKIMKDPVNYNETYCYSWENLYQELRKQICDENYQDTMIPLVQQLPESNGSRYFKKLPYRMGIIADEFLYHTYEDVADCIYITPDDYEYELDFLLVVTAWKGLNDEWRGLGKPEKNETRDKISEIIQYYKDRGVKVIFYSKEDPGNYYVFLDIAKKCDVIFTTAEECVEHYKEDTDVPLVDVLEFAINPVYHNPVGTCLNKIDEALFAGTWWNKKYPERKVDMSSLFEIVLKSGINLKLIDRNYSLLKPDYFYPVQYLKYVSPAIEHELLQKIERLYTYAININTSKRSETMYASRVYELQAMGKIILSNKSIGMEKKFPNIIVDNQNGNMERELELLDEKTRREKQIEGIRRVMTGETVYDRMNQILQAIGNSPIDYSKTVAVIVKLEKCELVEEQLELQTYKNIMIFTENELQTLDCKQAEMLVFWNEKYHYGSHYLEDMVNGFKYVNCDFITKDACMGPMGLVKGMEHNYINHVPDIYRTIFWMDNTNLEKIKAKSFEDFSNGYSIDYLNVKICEA